MVVPTYISDGRRCTFKISEHTPSALAISSNAHVLARYAAISQTVGLCPIIEPELLMEGDFTIERSTDAHIAVLAAVFRKLHVHNVLLEGMILKVSMVALPKEKASPQQVAEMTCRALSRTVPPALPGIVFLSGGQGDMEAIKNLQAINVIAKKNRSQHPWKLSFSYGAYLSDVAYSRSRATGRADESVGQRGQEKGAGFVY
jgi:fructose-bisphosphate aldolase, class I